MNTKSGSRSDIRRKVIAAVASTVLVLAVLAALAIADLLHKDEPAPLFSVTVFSEAEGGALLLACGDETALIIDGDDNSGDTIAALAVSLRTRRQLSPDLLLIKGSADNKECSASAAALEAAGLESEEIRFVTDAELTLGDATVKLDTADNGSHIITVDYRDGDLSITGDADTLCCHVEAERVDYVHNDTTIAVVQSDGKNVRVLRDLDAFL
ncbi:MAG: hypothetical protein J6V14_05555 [Clostridia bacterium]|nr:hypothetical protein [Clostridia bacterium]